MFEILRGRLATGVALGAALLTGAAEAQIAGNKLKVRVLTDMAAFASDSSAEGSVVMARLAIEDFRKKNGTLPAELIQADHQNKPDIGNSIAMHRITQEGVDAILDARFSSIALVIVEVLRDSKPR